MRQWYSFPSPPFLPVPSNLNCLINKSKSTRLYINFYLRFDLFKSILWRCLRQIYQYINVSHLSIYSNISWLKNRYKSCSKMLYTKWTTRKKMTKQTRRNKWNTERNISEWYRSAFEFSIYKKKKKKKLHEIALSLSPLQRLQRFFITVDRLNIVPW